ncbi:MAG: aroE [Ilumatobacteraceae bacterium]|nr:aroE [Ilumatobacteraceae bacterium]
MTGNGITGSTRLAGVIGSPVRHSLSPVIHNAAFAAAGLDWVFVAFEVVPGAAAAALAGMRAFGIAGLSVTMPHKDDVAAAVDVLDPAAAALGTVNTVVMQPDGRLAGHSTDGAGFVASLRDAAVDPTGMSVAVLGAGGAARSVIDALARAGASRIAVVNRSADRAAVAAALAGNRGSVGTPADIALADLVVNATSIGMATPGGDASAIPCDVSLLHASQVVADLVYHPLETSLLAAARACGAQAVDGLGMLVHQAALQQQLWTGIRPDPVAMRVAAERELAARELASR